MRPAHLFLFGVTLGACAAELDVPPTAPAAAFLGPTVTAVDPAPGAQGVPLDYPVRVTFNTSVDPATVFAALQARGLAGTAFPFTSAVDAAGRTLAVYAVWPAREAVRLTLSGALTDRRGVGLRDQDRGDDAADTPFALTFTTGADALTESPRVLAGVPGDGVLGLAARPGVRFSKRMRDAVVRFTARDAAAAHRLRWLDDGTLLTIEPAEALRPGTSYGLTVEAAVDAWGYALTGPQSFAFHTRASQGHVVVNEVVTAPEADWGESAGGNGVAFDGVPGTGTVSTSDEYVEIYNGTAETLDLTGWTLEQLDGSAQTYVVGGGGAAVERAAPAGSITAVPPGGYLVVGNMTGDMSDAVTLVLRDAMGLERDRVALAGAPAGGEAWARRSDGVDTDDAADWGAAPASPGGAN